MNHKAIRRCDQYREIPPKVFTVLIKSFFDGLKRLASDDAFQDVTEEEACHRFRVGLKNAELPEEKRNLLRYTNYALNYEAAKANLKETRHHQGRALKSDENKPDYILHKLVEFRHEKPPYRQN